MSQEDVTESERKEKEASSCKVKGTLSRIEQMEEKLQSLKHLYHKNVQSLSDKMKQEIENKNRKERKEEESSGRAEEEYVQFCDDQKTLKMKIKKLAQLVQKSKHFVALTGAGIVKMNGMKALPTVSHMALVALMENGGQYLKCVISQNTDGLHGRSGIDIDKLSELDGNGTVEMCSRCNKAYMRDYKCRGSLRKPLTAHDHFTGRYCSVLKCNGQLKDTIINFGEEPHEMALELGFEHSQKCDLFLCLASSLTVSPACDMPQTVGVKWNYEINNEMNKEPQHHLVIVNIEKTDLDYLCGLRIFANVDTVMVGLMKELEMDIPKWYLKRYVKIVVNDLENRGDLRKLTVCGVDIDGTNFSIFTDVKLSNNGKKIMRYGIQRRMSIDNLLVLAKKNINRKYNYKKDEFVFHIPTISIIDSEYHDHTYDENKKDVYDVSDKGLELELSFYAHYKEPNLVIELNEYLCHLSQENGCIVLKIIFDPVNKQWNIGDKREQLSHANVKKLWSNYNEKPINDNNDHKPLPNPYELRNDD